MPLVKSIVSFDTKDNAEIQACDLCLEIDQLELIEQHLDKMNFNRICNYLANCANYRLFDFFSGIRCAIHVLLESFFFLKEIHKNFVSNVFAFVPQFIRKNKTWGYHFLNWMEHFQTPWENVKNGSHELCEKFLNSKLVSASRTRGWLVPRTQ